MTKKAFSWEDQDEANKDDEKFFSREGQDSIQKTMEAKFELVMSADFYSFQRGLMESKASCNNCHARRLRDENIHRVFFPLPLIDDSFHATGTRLAHERDYRIYFFLLPYP